MEGLECRAKPGSRQARCSWGAVNMVMAGACMGWQEERKAWVCRRRLNQGMNHRLCLFFVPLVVGTAGGGF